MTRILLPAALLVIHLAVLQPAGAQDIDTEDRAAATHCPAEIVYGDPSNADILEYEVNGMVRRLHFERIGVEDIGQGRYEVTIPRIVTEPAGHGGWINAHPASDQAPRSMGMGTGRASFVLTLDPNAQFSSSRIDSREMLMPSLDCLNQVSSLNFRNLVDGWRSEATITAAPGADGYWLTVQSVERATGAELRLSIQSLPRTRASASEAALATLGEAEIDARAILDPDLHVLYLEPQASADEDGMITVRGTQTLPLPDMGERIARESRGELEIWVYKTIADDFLIVERHGVSLGSGDETTLIVRPRASLSRPLDDVALGDDTRRARYVVTRLTRESLPPLVVRSEDSPERRAAPLAIGDLPSDAPLLTVLQPIEPHEVMFGFRGRLARLMLEETSTEGRRTLSLTLDEVDAPELVAASTREQLVEQLGEDGLQALLEIFDHGELYAMAWERDGDRDAFIEWMSSVLDRLDIPTDGIQTIESPDAVFEILEGRFDESTFRAAQAVIEAQQAAEFSRLRPLVGALAAEIEVEDPATMDRDAIARHLAALEMDVPAYTDPEEYLYAIFRQLDSRFGDAYRRFSMDRLMEVERDRLTVTFDPVTAAPFAREARIHHGPDEFTTDVRLLYSGNASRIEASNRAQGQDVLEVPLPEAVLDTYQFFAVLPFVDIGEETHLYLVDAIPSMSYSYSSDDGASQRVRIAIEPSHMVVRPDGNEPLDIGGTSVDARRLEVHFSGEPPAPIDAQMARSLQVGGDGMTSFEVLVLPDTPHHLLLVRQGDDELRAFPSGDTRLPADAAGRWLIDVTAVR